VVIVVVEGGRGAVQNDAVKVVLGGGKAVSLIISNKTDGGSDMTKQKVKRWC